MSIVVFWLEHTQAAAPVARHESFSERQLKEALHRCEELRKHSELSHVTMCSELPAMVGKAGVDTVLDGKTPDGHAYDWSKSGRAGKFKTSDLNKAHTRPDQQT